MDRPYEQARAEIIQIATRLAVAESDPDNQTRHMADYVADAIALLDAVDVQMATRTTSRTKVVDVAVSGDWHMAKAVSETMFMTKGTP